MGKKDALRKRLVPEKRSCTNLSLLFSHIPDKRRKALLQ